MSHPLTRVPFLGQFVDERFLDHRRRASSTAGILVCVLAIVLFEDKFIRYNIWDWNLFAIVLVFLVLKTSLFFWYRAHR